MEDKGWKIERTTFPFMKVEPKPPNPSSRLIFQCVGDSAMSFMSFLYNENPYTLRDSYDQTLQTSNGKSVNYTFYCDYYNESFDPLNLSKPTNVPQDQIILAIIRDQSSIQDMYLTCFPRIFKSTSALTRQLVIVHIKMNQDGDLTEEQLNTAAEFIGASHIVTIDRKLVRREETVVKICEDIVVQVPAKISYTDENMVKRFYMLALVSVGNLSQIQKQSNLLDPNYVDPLGNNILHYAVQQVNREEFYYIADRFPELINKQNLDDATPILKFITRHFNYIDWDKFWQLPIDFSVKNNAGVTCLEKIQNNKDSFKAFEALMKNERAWKRARKYHRRKRLLTNVVHQILIDWAGSDLDPPSELPKKVEFFVKNGASIHHHENKSLLNTAIKHKRRQAAIKLLELGAKLRDEDIIACWGTGREEMIRLVINRPEMNSLSLEQLNDLAQCTTSTGLIDVLQTLIRKGGKVELKSNKHGKVTTGNLIAQMHCNSIIIPLKFQCVDIIYESVARKNKERNKTFGFTGDEAQIDWDRELKGYPEEIRDLFPRKELWRWALFLQDEKKQSLILKLYHAINRRVKSTKEKRTLELTCSSVKFCFSSNGSEQLIWLGDLNSKSPKHRMYYKESSDTTGGGYIEWYYDKEESNKEVLVQVMTECGWDLEDTYVFLHILHTAFISNPDSVYLQRCFFTSYVYEFLKPPQWYAEFVKQVYGLEHPPRPMDNYSTY